MAPTHTPAGAGLRPRPAIPPQMGCEGPEQPPGGPAVPLPPLPSEGTKAGGGTRRRPDSVGRDGAGPAGRHRLLKARPRAWCAPLGRWLPQRAAHPLGPGVALRVRVGTGLSRAGPAGCRFPAEHGGASESGGPGGAAQEPEATAGEAPARAHQREPEAAQGAHPAAAGQGELPLLEAGEGGHPGNDRALPAGAACVLPRGPHAGALGRLRRGLPRLPGTPGPRAARLPRPGARGERPPAGAPAREGERPRPRRWARWGPLRPAHALPAAPTCPRAAGASPRPRLLEALVAPSRSPDPADCKTPGALGRPRKLVVSAAVSTPRDQLSTRNQAGTWMFVICVAG